MKVITLLALLLVLPWARPAAASPQSQLSPTDGEIAAQVQERIDADASILYEKVTVNFNNGVVTLSGYVDSNAARTAAANDAAQVAGVKTVINNLQIGPETATPAQAAQALAAIEKPNSNNSPAVTNNPPTLPQPIILPAGTELDIRVFDEVNSQTVRAGDLFRGSIAFPVMAGSAIAIPTTAKVQGRVIAVKPARSFGRAAVLTLQLTKLVIHGASYPLQTGSWSRAGRGDIGTIAAETGGATASGAAVGAAIGGGKGAGIGAGVGVAAGVITAGLTKGEPIVITPEAIISFTIRSPLTLGTTPADGSLPTSSGPDAK